MYTFQHYYLIAHLFRKSGHDTYLAYRVEEPERRVLLKVFDDACLASTATPSAVRQMEARLQSLKHPHIVPLLALGLEQGQLYSVNEYHPGGSLRQYLAQRASGHVSLEEAVGVVMQVGQALVYAHAQGVLHQDIRLENILLNEQGQALLADFRMDGLLVEREQEPVSSRRVVSYRAPEQVIGEASAASDQYALGCLLYELLTGTPASASALRHRGASSTPVAATAQPTLPQPIEGVILRTLAIKPHERYQDVETLLAELKAAVQPEPPAFPFARLTAKYQLTPLSEEQEAMETFPPLFPVMPFPAQPAQEEALPHEEPTLQSLETFLTSPAWDGASLLDRLAIADGQDDVLILSGASEIDASSSREHRPMPEVQEPEVDKADPPLKMTFVNALSERLSAQSLDLDISILQEKLPAPEPEKDLASLPVPEGDKEEKAASTVQMKEPVEERELHANRQKDTQFSSESTLPFENLQNSVSDVREKNQQKFAALARYDWRRPIVLLGIALAAIMISTLLMYSFNTKALTEVGSGHLASAGSTGTVATQTRSTFVSSTTRVPHSQPTPPPSPSAHQAPASSPQPSTAGQSTSASSPQPTKAPVVTAPLGKIIWLQAIVNSNYVSTRLDHSDARLVAGARAVSTWEEFDVVGAANGYVALIAHANGNYICAQLNQVNSPVQASSSSLQSCAEFRWIDEGNGEVVLEMASSTRYVGVRNDLSSAPLSVGDTTVQSRELFLWGVV